MTEPQKAELWQCGYSARCLAPERRRRATTAKAARNRSSLLRCCRYPAYRSARGVNQAQDVKPRGGQNTDVFAGVGDPVWGLPRR